MRRAVVDTSALAAIVFDEPGAATWVRRLEGAVLFAPTLLQYELQSVARKKCRLNPDDSSRIVRALAIALDPRAGITWMDPDPSDVVLIANATGLTADDASYLCLAGALDADLMTADGTLAAALDPFARSHGRKVARL
jgi:predicted nucleic acid-binding protein